MAPEAVVDFVVVAVVVVVVVVVMVEKENAVVVSWVSAEDVRCSLPKGMMKVDWIRRSPVHRQPDG